VEITIDRKYRGPLTSANGGYACGRLAAFVGAGQVEVTLRRPPPLDRPLRVAPDGRGVRLLDGDEIVAEARPAEVGVVPSAPVSVLDATEARSRHVRAGDAVLFAECFTCGIRTEADGLGVHVGAVAGREPLHAAPITFVERSREVVWAAIDCPGAYAVGAEGRGTLVLGRMTARVDRLPEAGETCVVAAWPLGEDGRKLFAGTALFGHDGDLLALARQVWIEPR